ncbi:hypothetical protein I4U23_015609 [Adineta vaga]|nr:hypothetical protein I4U23_015609 [Adineta vaga]
MLLFGILMIINIRQSRHRVQPLRHNQQQRFRSNEQQLCVMLAIQVLTTTLISAPYSILIVYHFSAVTIYKYITSSNALLILYFVRQLCAIVYYSNCVFGFYTYILTSRKFRGEFKYCFQYGMNFIVRKFHLEHYLPMRIQQMLLFNRND